MINDYIKKLRKAADALEDPEQQSVRPSPGGPPSKRVAKN
jgi:hypothetical protein